MRPPVIRPTARGLYCEAGDFYIDPVKPVPRALITHAHSDHARPGSGEYLCAESSVRLLEERVGKSATLRGVRYREMLDLGATQVSFHPAGHVLGSAQIRILVGGECWVVSGDYKREPDPTCAPFEPVECDVFITEGTFSLPIYRWQPTIDVAREILEWWDDNRAQGKTSVLFAYALGKAQRIIAELAGLSARMVLTHGAVEKVNETYRASGVLLPPTHLVVDEKRSYAGELVLAPPSAYGSRWLKRFGEISTGFASGWMVTRANRRRRGYDRGFVLSDHADWPGLLQTIHESRARRVLLTHGDIATLTRYLREQGVRAEPLESVRGGRSEQ